MNRRAFLAALGGSFLAAPLAAEAPPAGTVRIGWLAPARVPSDVATFRGQLRDLGWIEGKNMSTEERYSEGKSERLPSLAADLVRLKVDVIVAISTLATAAAQQATGSIPVVFVAGSDPVERGFVASFGRPGGNLTGIASLNNEMLNAKMLEVLRSAVPRITRVGVFLQPTLTQRQSMTAVAAAARALSVQLVPIEVRGAGDIDHSAATLAKERVHAFLVLSNPFFHAEKERFVKLATAMRLPAIYEQRGFVESGGLMSYGFDLREVFGRLAVMVDKILKGAKPGDLPVEQPTKFELVINAKTAKALGLTIPPSLLVRTDEVIQ